MTVALEHPSIIDILPTLPYPIGADAPRCRAVNGYPVLEQVARVLLGDDGAQIVEIGTALGYSAITLLRACPQVLNLIVVDNESYVEGSLIKAHANIDAYFRAYESQRDPPAITYARTTDAAYYALPYVVGLAHIDGDHSYDAVRYDLDWVRDSAGAQTIVVDDYLNNRDVNEAVNDWAYINRASFVVVHSVHGQAVFDFTDDDWHLRESLVLNGIPVVTEVPPEFPSDCSIPALGRP